MMTWIAVFVGGGIGSLMRYSMGVLAKHLFPAATFPSGTLLSNIFSCLIFGVFFLIVLPRVKYGDSFQFFILTGICGGFSTFSTFSFETFQLWRDQHHILAFVNVLLNLVLCLSVFWLLFKKFGS